MTGLLTETQEWMAALLRHARDLTQDPAFADAARVHVTGNDRLTPIEQVEIYREQFWLRHTGSLIEDFPGLSGILGQDDWDELAVSYLKDVTPTSFSLRDLGHAMPAHVERATWLPHHALCIDMARLEWAYVELFDAEEAPPLDATKLAAMPEEAWETARIVLSPALALLRVTYPVPELRRRLKAGSHEHEHEHDHDHDHDHDHGRDSVSIPEPAPANLVLYRGKDLSLYATAVSDAAFALLGALGDGVALVPACERAAAQVPAGAEEIQEKAGEWFLDWGRRGWVVDVR